jgi:transaldolase
VEKSFDSLVQAGKAQAADRARFIGKVGVANSKLAYASYERIFGAARFKKLQESNGARVQRPLWASTGTKNPAFKAVMYVEELAGRDTVNTMPPTTVKAVLEGATVKPALHEGLVDAKALLAWVESQGLSMAMLLQDLQSAGVKSFADSYRDLLASIDEKRTKV